MPLKVETVKYACAAALLILLAAGAARAQGAPQLSLPIACTLGKDCFVQNYVDVQPGPGIKDYRCGQAAYEEHDGTDFRVLSLRATEAGVPVIAAASGRVKALRDDVEDRLVETDADRAAIAGRDCGNGVVIDHGGGWETQYCHMRRASVTVREGQTVAAGTPLGLVGFSGRAQFAHVHLAVRQNGKSIDPFLGTAANDICLAPGATLPTSLWAPGLTEQLAYRDGVIIETGFSSAPLSPEAAEEGRRNRLATGSPALVFFARTINMRAGDSLRLAIEGPEGFTVASEVPPLERGKATFVGFAGRKRQSESWPAGLYQGRAEVVRGGAVIDAAKAEIKLE
jgi:peptidase M23-like protein